MQRATINLGRSAGMYIDKPGSKDKRPLGIPTVRDRVVKAALRLVIEPIFEREFIAAQLRVQAGAWVARMPCERLIDS